MVTVTLKRNISKVPVYYAPEMYPSSPLPSFPPPAPMASRSLQDRAGVSLRIKTNVGSTDNAPYWSPVKNSQPHRTNLPRRRNPKRMRTFPVDTPVSEKVPIELKEKEQEKSLVDEKKSPEQPVNEKSKALFEEVEPDLFVAPEVLLSRPTGQVIGLHPQDSDQLQEIIPGLCIAFSDDGPSAVQPEPTEGRSWTHIVNITYPAETETLDHNGTCEQTSRDGVQRLHIVLPTVSRAQLKSSARPGLGLTDAHLRTVRDFIAQALPRTLAELPGQKDICILVTAPHGRPTDAMCAVACYLSFASGRSVDDVLRLVDEEEDFLSIWKGEVSGDECDRTQKIARSWSWLNQVNNKSPSSAK